MARCKSDFSHWSLLHSLIKIKRSVPPLKMESEPEDIILREFCTDLTVCCPYSAVGCRIQNITWENFVIHVKQCPYRPLNCYNTTGAMGGGGGCTGTEIAYDWKSIVTHLTSEHDVSIHQQNDDFSPSFEWTNDMCADSQKIHTIYPNTVMECGYKYKGKLFFKNSMTKNGRRIWWFSILGTDEQAKNYTACLRIKKFVDGKPNVRVPQWVLPVVSFRKNLSEVLQAKKTASFPLSLDSIRPLSTIRMNYDDLGKLTYKAYGWCIEVKILKT